MTASPASNPSPAVPPATPAEMRAYIVERLVGDTGAPERVLAAARALGEAAEPPFGAGLAGLLATRLAVELKGVELARTVDARGMVEKGDLLVVASGAGASDAAFMALDGQALALCVSAMFGGDPALPPVPIARDPSPIEREVAAAVLAELAQALNGAGTLGLHLPLPDLLAGAEARKFMPRDGPAAKLTFRVAAGANSGEISVLVLQRLLLARAPAAPAASAPAEWGTHFGGEIMRSALAVEAVMPLARMTLGALGTFAVGDTIPLDAGATGDARLLVRGKMLFVCEFGRLGAHYTVRVKEPFSAAKDFMDGLLPG